MNGTSYRYLSVLHSTYAKDYINLYADAFKHRTITKKLMNEGYKARIILLLPKLTCKKVACNVICKNP